MNAGPFPYLLTPGPLSTSRATKEAMLRDWGSWDEDFNVITAGICTYLRQVIHDDDDKFVCVPMQGSGTFAMEATLGTLIEKDQGAKTLVISNGAYGQRIAKTFDYLGRPYCVLDKGDCAAPLPEEVDDFLHRDKSIRAVVIVHCETSAGILNPLAEIAEVVHRHGKRFFIDAMSSFAALSLDSRKIPYDACVSSANKCLEGVPGFGFVLVRKSLLSERRHHSHSLSLDLYEQWQGLAQTGKWRYTPPTHVVAACAEAIRQHAEEGGAPARLARYQENHRILVGGMRELGFSTLLEDRWQSPIITTFLSPGDTNFSFPRFYQLLKDKGFIIYPGKLTAVESFRLGTIGQVNGEVMRAVVTAIGETLAIMKVRSGAAAG